MIEKIQRRNGHITTLPEEQNGELVDDGYLLPYLTGVLLAFLAGLLLAYLYIKTTRGRRPWQEGS
ncbi:MAG: hypothetical protein GYB65_08435 [Chloroflexi bacterium]|nr:hypothetical protein [Chloroflexota bacterium]